MSAHSLGEAAAKVRRALEASTAKARATEFARRVKAAYEEGKAGDAEPAGDEAAEANEAEEVAAAMRGVDWDAVRAATSERSASAATAMRAMAAEVDWARVQPVAATVSSALIAAVASGQLGIGGRAGSTVARAIINDRDLAQRVSTSLRRTESAMPPDFREQMAQRAIDTTATD